MAKGDSTLSGAANPAWKGGPIKKTCQTCGNDFLAQRWQAEQKFCCHQCYAESRTRKDNRRKHPRPHILLVETLLNVRLPDPVCIHHVDGNRRNNQQNNFVVCPNQAYHLLLHARTRIVNAGGIPSVHKICSSCKQVKTKGEFYKGPEWDGRRSICKVCLSILARERRGRENLTA